MMLAELTAWLQGLDDGYLTDWANRGLLRRGRKLAEGLEADVCRVTESDCTAAIEGHTQALMAPGFKDLSCSCPAAGPCHHLIAFLLCLQCHPDLATRTERDDAGPLPWLVEDFSALEKLLGRTHVKRARRLLLQGPEIVLDEGEGGLIAVITDSARHTVRIPRSPGLVAATCTCNAERCVHRALAVLQARQQAGLYDPRADLDEVLDAPQREVVSQVRDWLREWVAQGSAGISRASMERGEALATVARQADFPLLASQVTGMVKLQKDELAGRAFVDIHHFRLQLTQVWARLRALQTTPLPQPLNVLAGEHKRHYRLIHHLELIGVGAEIWHSQTNYLGLSVHFYAPAEQAWYRHSQARSLQQAEVSSWSPQQCWKSGAIGGLAYRRIPGAHIRIFKGWVSSDRQLSGRDGTVLEVLSPELAETVPPIATDFAGLARDYGHRLSANPLVLSPSLPVIVRVAGATEPIFDRIEQILWQRLLDTHQRALRLEVTVRDEGSAAISKTLERLWCGGKRWDTIFGLLSHRERTLLLSPISIRCQGESPWTHLTL